MLSECKGRSLHANKKQNWAGLWTNNCATIQQVLTLKFPFRPEKFPGLSRNRSQDKSADSQVNI